ncbi:MAG: hypothetical protein ACOC5T_05135 [Elusimicrobiota bacterium]
MKKIVGVILIITGIAIGLYVGVWECFAGGVADIINVIKSDCQASPSMVLLPLIKITFSSFIGFISSFIGIIPGIVLMNYRGNKEDVNV